MSSVMSNEMYQLIESNREILIILFTLIIVKITSDIYMMKEHEDFRANRGILPKNSIFSLLITYYIINFVNNSVTFIQTIIIFICATVIIYTVTSLKRQR